MNFIFFIFPVLGLFTGVKNFISNNSSIPIVIFGFWFGYSVFYYSGDILHYRDNFKYLIDYSWTDFFTILINNYSREGIDIFNSNNLYHVKPDVFAITLGFLISRVTDEPRFFFATLGAIYFFLLSRFLHESVIYTNGKKNKNWKLFFIFLVLIVPFYVGITGVRFWTALFLFAWMVLKYINTGKNRFVRVAALSCFVHYTFIFPIIVLFVTFFLRINRVIFQSLIVIGVFYALLSNTTSSFDYISETLKFFDNEVIEESASGYLDQDKLSERNTEIVDANWYVQWRVNLINAFFLLSYLWDFFYMRIKNPIKSKFFERLYDFFFLISLFTLNLGSIGRFVYIFYFFILIRLMELHSNAGSNKFSFLAKIAFPVIAIQVLVTFRAGFYYVDPYLIFMPSITLLFAKSEISLSQLLIGH